MSNDRLQPSNWAAAPQIEMQLAVHATRLCQLPAWYGPKGLFAADKTFATHTRQAPDFGRSIRGLHGKNARVHWSNRNQQSSTCQSKL